jgi:hypothetical protein
MPLKDIDVNRQETSESDDSMICGNLKGWGCVVLFLLPHKIVKNLKYLKIIYKCYF